MRSYLLIKSYLVFTTNILCHMSVKVDIMLTYLYLGRYVSSSRKNWMWLKNASMENCKQSVSYFAKSGWLLISFNPLVFYSRVLIKYLCSLLYSFDSSADSFVYLKIFFPLHWISWIYNFGNNVQKFLK